MFNHVSNQICPARACAFAGLFVAVGVASCGLRGSRKSLSCDKKCRIDATFWPVAASNRQNIKKQET